MPCITAFAGLAGNLPYSKLFVPAGITSVTQAKSLTKLYVGVGGGVGGAGTVTGVMSGSPAVLVLVNAPLHK